MGDVSHFRGRIRVAWYNFQVIPRQQKKHAQHAISWSSIPFTAWGVLRQAIDDISVISVRITFGNKTGRKENGASQIKEIKLKKKIGPRINMGPEKIKTRRTPNACVLARKTHTYKQTAHKQARQNQHTEYLCVSHTAGSRSLFLSERLDYGIS